ncbi:MAG: S24/S26 family peptidase [Ruminococcus sp.]|nr:S24/S26 family peptidase [Ruminococcus sp.]
MSKTTFEEVIAKNGKLVYTNVGDSMFPLIKQGRDLLIIEKPNGRLKKYDIPLYKRDSGQYVLHRILKVRENDYVICGDNRSNKEYGVTDRHIIGILTGIIRNNKTIKLHGFCYRMYLFLWCDLFPLRAFVLRVFRKLKSL